MAKKKRNRSSWVQDYFFLIVPQPLEDELLSSWITRVALEHKRQLSIFLTLFVKKEGSQISRTDIDFLYDEKLYEALVNKSNLTKEDIFKMSLRSEEGYLYSFQAKHKMENAGSFKVSYRMFPKNADLPHRQDFCYVRWFV